MASPWDSSCFSLDCTVFPDAYQILKTQIRRILKTRIRQRNPRAKTLIPRIMPEAFNIGDRVQLLDEDLEGWIQAIGAAAVRILTKDGLEMEVAPEDLVRIPEDATSEFRKAGVPVTTEGFGSKKPARGRVSAKKNKIPPLEVDLHADTLFPNLQGINPYEILDMQLDTARRQLDFAFRKRIQRVVFIHGVGQGVLREELRTLFRRHEGIRFGDADFRTYGEGATEVYIPQSCFL